MNMQGWCDDVDRVEIRTTLVLKLVNESRSLQLTDL
jgi:hypothetical protein